MGERGLGYLQFVFPYRDVGSMHVLAIDGVYVDRMTIKTNCPNPTYKCKLECLIMEIFFTSHVCTTYICTLVGLFKFRNIVLF
jgi:hypothetical protein